MREERIGLLVENVQGDLDEFNLESNEIVTEKSYLIVVVTLFFNANVLIRLLREVVIRFAFVNFSLIFKFGIFAVKKSERYVFL